MRKKRVDSNHAELRDYMRKLGAIVKDTSKFGEGFPDVMVKFCGVIFFIEIKKDEKAKLTKAEQEFKEFIGKKYNVVCSKEDINKLFGV